MTMKRARVKPSTGARRWLRSAGMSEPATPPEECTSMAQVRAGVDATDMARVSLLAQRFAYMRAAARI